MSETNVERIRRMVAEAKAEKSGDDWWTLLPRDWYEGMSDVEVAEIQLHEDILIMPWEVFHGAMEAALGRPVWTHEFANSQRLKDELAGVRPTAGPEEIFGELEAYGKPVIYVATEDENAGRG